MATISQELEFFRQDNSSDISRFPDDVGLRYYNDVRDEIIDAIIEAKEDFFYNYIDTQTIIGQNEYMLPKRGQLAGDAITILDGFHKIKAVSWKVKATDTEYTLLPTKNMDTLEYAIESYSETNTPFCIIQDNSIFIYPTPTEVSNLRFHGIVFYKKVILGDTDRLPDQYTKAITLGIAKRYFQSKLLVNESIQASQIFEAEKERLVKALKGRISKPIQRQNPSISYLS